MSAAAHQSLTPKQLNNLREKHGSLSSSLDTIEACGGGKMHDGRNILPQQ
jgi:hypothetical protein